MTKTPTQETTNHVPRQRPRAVMRSAGGKVAVMLVLTSLVSLGLGVVAGLFIKSPAQIAADSTPPKPSTITAAVTEGEIVSTLQFNGAVTLGNTLDLAPALTASTPIVTKLAVAPGTAITSGTVLAEISDRPVFYLEGEIPLIRDLNQGDRGPDITRLQQALAPWGAGAPSGVFDWNTAAAINSLYRQSGYDPPENSAALQSELVFAPSATATVISVNAAVGAAAATPLLQITTSNPVVTAEVSETVAQQLQLTQQVTVSSAALGEGLVGTVSAINAAVKGADGVTRIPVVVALETEIPLSAITAAVEISVPTASSGEAGILVPLAALFSDSSNGTVVRKINGQKSTRVPVQVVETGDGKARISVVEGELKVGDKVLVSSQ